jgi:cytochrome c2
MRNIFIVLILLIAGCAGNDRKTPTDDAVNTGSIDGERLFKNNCASCHRIDKNFTGPSLHGSLERWGGDKKAMYTFIRNPSKSIAENAYAKKLFEKWNRTLMTSFNFSDAELDAIMNYTSFADPAVAK